MYAIRSYYVFFFKPQGEAKIRAGSARLKNLGDEGEVNGSDQIMILIIMIGFLTKQHTLFSLDNQTKRGLLQVTYQFRNNFV